MSLFYIHRYLVSDVYYKRFLKPFTENIKGWVNSVTCWTNFFEDVKLQYIMYHDSPTAGGMLSRRASRVLLPCSLLSVMLASRKDTPNSLSFTIPIRLPLVLRGTSPVSRNPNIKDIYEFHMPLKMVCMLFAVESKDVKSLATLPGHKPVWHFFESVFGPLQERPPFAGAGLLHSLIRSWTPWPHVLLHGPHSSQLE